MPTQYERIRDRVLADGEPERDAKRIAAATYNRDHPENPVTNKHHDHAASAFDGVDALSGFKGAGSNFCAGGFCGDAFVGIDALAGDVKWLKRRHAEHTAGQGAAAPKPQFAAGEAKLGDAPKHHAELTLRGYSHVGTRAAPPGSKYTHAHIYRHRNGREAFLFHHRGTGATKLIHGGGGSSVSGNFAADSGDLGWHSPDSERTRAIHATLDKLGYRKLHSLHGEGHDSHAFQHPRTGRIVSHTVIHERGPTGMQEHHNIRQSKPRESTPAPAKQFAADGAPALNLEAGKPVVVVVKKKTWAFDAVDALTGFVAAG